LGKNKEEGCYLGNFIAKRDEEEEKENNNAQVKSEEHLLAVHRAMNVCACACARIHLSSMQVISWLQETSECERAHVLRADD